jgi:hypothetical protein
MRRSSRRGFMATVMALLAAVPILGKAIAAPTPPPKPKRKVWIGHHWHR